MVSLLGCPDYEVLVDVLIVDVLIVDVLTVEAGFDHGGSDNPSSVYGGSTVHIILLAT